MKLSTKILPGTLTAFAAVSVVHADYKLTDNIVGKGFYDAFDWKAIPDPTNGRVKYVDQATSKSENLTYASDNSFILRSDFKKVVSGSSSGRDSVRIESKKKFTHHVSVYDVRHIPTGCGTWPAIWETDPDIYGEIDIAEGADSEAQNTATFWTDPNGACSQSVKEDLDDPNSKNVLRNCKDGCEVNPPSKKSFGLAFNQNGGGWYAMQRTSTYVKIWFWERSNGSVPAEVKNGANSVNPDAWGTPFFHMTNEHCDIEKNLKAHNLIINLTFCGANADSPQFENAGCPGTCKDTVDNNPGEFKNAYFNMAAIRVYQ